MNMEIKLPDINFIIERLLPEITNFDKPPKTIEQCVNENRQTIAKSILLIENRSDSNDIEILKMWFVNLLMRSVNADVAKKLETSINEQIKTKDDLNEKVLNNILKDSHYRWHNDGVQVMMDVVKYFKEHNWNWKEYFEEANNCHTENFPDDKLLEIKHVSYKVRDLALSCFNHNYIANDIHIVRVATRLGLLNYGFDLFPDSKIEMGNNPADRKHYLFLHKLFVELSKLTDNKYSLSDLDRIFWYFGREICTHDPNCKVCPIRDMCLTGKI